MTGSRLMVAVVFQELDQSVAVEGWVQSPGVQHSCDLVETVPLCSHSLYASLN